MERNPKLDPLAGDVFRKWNQDIEVVRIHQGCVWLKGQPNWIGLLRFRAMFADSEVVAMCSLPTPACCFCEEPVEFLDSQTTTSDGPCHLRCWNDAWIARTEYAAEREDEYGVSAPVVARRSPASSSDLRGIPFRGPQRASQPHGSEPSLPEAMPRSGTR